MPPFFLLLILVVEILEKIEEGKFGAFKAKHEDVFYVLKFKLLSEKGGFRRIPSNTHHYREVAAYLLDKEILEFNIVPETKLILHDGKEASCQKFVSGKKINSSIFRESGHHGLIDGPITRNVILFDLIVNNTDRHIRSCIFNKKESKVWAIDNGCCFGQYYNYYYNVFHRYLYSDTLILTDNERKLLNSIQKSQLYKIIGPYLEEEEEVEQTYYRIQWILEQEDLSFKFMSGNQEDRRFYPSRSKWFKQRMSNY